MYDNYPIIEGECSIIDNPMLGNNVTIDKNDEVSDYNLLEEGLNEEIEIKHYCCDNKKVGYILFAVFLLLIVYLIVIITFF
tara:strand:+ start:756 stop:998 length:243 start_codon:yes stop_codon:yes gene_type:complete